MTHEQKLEVKKLKALGWQVSKLTPFKYNVHPGVEVTMTKKGVPYNLSVCIWPDGSFYAHEAIKNIP